MSRLRGSHASLRYFADWELDNAARGCTELTCTEHGAINAERHRRGRLPSQRSGGHR